MESLPSDIVLEFLSWVPAEYVLECKLVCKRWRTLICGSNFTNMHLGRQLNHLHGGEDGNYNPAAMVEPCLFFACGSYKSGNYETLLFNGGQPSDRISMDEKYIYSESMKRIYHPILHKVRSCNHLVGSCNGLVCAFQLHHKVADPIYICNPLTREYVHLPELVVKEHFTEGAYADLYYDGAACGFGYVPSKNEYKVVRIYYPDYKEGNVEVYTLGSGCGWKPIDKVPYRLATLSGGRGTYANGAIYWIFRNKIVSFDLDKEKFELLSGPPCLQNRLSEDKCGLVALC